MNYVTAPFTGANIATDEIGLINYQKIKVAFGVDGAATDVTSGDPLPVQVISSGSVAVTGTFWQATQPVSGPLTDTQLRAVPVPSSYPQATSGTFVTVNSGPSFTAFSSQACKALSVLNATGQSLEFRRGGSGATFILPDGASYVFTGLTNASNMQVKRVDGGAAVDVRADALT